jgi:ubiquitin C-terminal hydrolase
MMNLVGRRGEHYEEPCDVIEPLCSHYEIGQIRNDYVLTHEGSCGKEEKSSFTLGYYHTVYVPSSQQFEDLFSETSEEVDFIEECTGCKRHFKKYHK